LGLQALGLEQKLPRRKLPIMSKIIADITGELDLLKESTNDHNDDETQAYSADVIPLTVCKNSNVQQERLEERKAGDTSELLFIESYYKSKAFIDAAQKLFQILLNSELAVNLIESYLELSLVYKLTDIQIKEKLYLLEEAEQDIELSNAFDLVDIIAIDLLDAGEQTKASILYNFKESIRNLKSIFTRVSQKIDLEKFGYLVNHHAPKSFEPINFLKLVKQLEINYELIKQTIENKKKLKSQCNPELEKYKIFTQLLNHSDVYQIHTQEYLNSAGSPIIFNNDKLTVIKVIEGKIICHEGDISKVKNELGIVNQNSYELKPGNYHVLNKGSSYRIVNTSHCSSKIIKFSYIGDRFNLSSTDKQISSQ